MIDCVFVRGLEFEGNHGYTAAERRGTRRFRVNLTLELPLAAAALSDKISDTVDYWKVSEVVVALGTKSTFKLLEALAGAIGGKIQELYPHAAVSIEIEKLAPPCPGVPAACGVKLYIPARQAEPGSLRSGPARQAEPGSLRSGPAGASRQAKP